MDSEIAVVSAIDPRRRVAGSTDRVIVVGAGLDRLDGLQWAVAWFGAGLADRLLTPTVFGLYFHDLAGSAAVSPLLPHLTDRVTDTCVVRWAQAMPSVPIGHARRVTAYRTGVTPTAPIVLAGDYLGFPWTDAAAFNGLWAADRLLGHHMPHTQ